MVIYIRTKGEIGLYMDLYFFVNGILDGLLLYLTGKITDQEIQVPRIMLGALGGAACAACWYWLREGRSGSFVDFFIMLVVAIAMDMISWGGTSLKKRGVRLGWLFGMSMLLAGIIQMCKGWLSGGLSPVVLFITAAGICLGIGTAIPLYYRLSGRSDHVGQVRCRMGDAWITFYGWLDSGNLLRDPISKKAVIVVEEKLLAGLHLSAAVPIPYRTIDVRGGILWGYYPDELWVQIKQQERRVDWVIGTVSDPIKIHGCQAILPAEWSG
ncbi:MAG: sigma-E processing peptidase SpoIIGA [Firmicutes bacterium]|nr:sigma-E processing peptidase SpoIIGA [Bacillota bacterium]